MKRCITIFLFLLAVVGLRAQVSSFPYEKVTKAMNCRMMKVKAQVVIQRANQQVSEVAPINVHFTLCYGAQSSGYASDDYIYLLGDDSNEWNSNGCMGFMDMPTGVSKTTELKDVDGDFVLYAFYGHTYKMAVTCEKTGDARLKSGNSIIILTGDNDKGIGYVIDRCDFYDISSGQERLVLEGYQPSKDDYSAGNLFRVFMDRMYEYYNR